jgi:hypothetical protein
MSARTKPSQVVWRLGDLPLTDGRGKPRSAPAGAERHGRPTDVTAAFAPALSRTSRSPRRPNETDRAAVKPPAQPTLVRTQHQPPPAETQSDLRIRRSADRPPSRGSALTVTSGIPVPVAVHRRMTDGRSPVPGRRRGVLSVRALPGRPRIGSPAVAEEAAGPTRARTPRGQGLEPRTRGLRARTCRCRRGPTAAIWCRFRRSAPDRGVALCRLVSASCAATKHRWSTATGIRCSVSHQVGEW